MWLLLFFFLIFEQLSYLESCVSFICINSCGASIQNNGFKLILLNNRDESFSRLTKPASFWTINSEAYTNDRKANIFGPLDIHNGFPPQLYSTWLAMNEYGNLGNLLFYLSEDEAKEKKGRGEIVSNYMLENSINFITENFLEDLSEAKHSYKKFNLILLEMSEISGNYSAFYLNNANESQSYKKLNNNEAESFIFSISNSDIHSPFRKAIEGKKQLSKLIKEFENLMLNKQEFIDKLFNDILFNNTPLYPDEILAKSINNNSSNNNENKDLLESISSIKSNYLNYWPDARTRTSTLVLVDYNNHVNYYEFNLSSIHPEVWSSRNQTFKIKPYSNKSMDFLLNGFVKSYCFDLIIITLAFNQIRF